MSPVLLMDNTAVEADRPAWLDARRALVTASEIGVILGLTPGHWGSPYALYHDKIGTPGGDWRVTEEQQLGTYLEPWIASRFAARHPDLRIGDGGLFARAGRPWQAATFDRLAYPSWVRDTSPRLAELAIAPVQLKSSGSMDDWGADPDDGIVPDYIRAQCLWEASVLGDDTPAVFVPMMFRPTGKIRTYLIDVDAGARADQEWMIEEALKFRAMIETRTPPPVDWRKATTRALQAQYPAIRDDSWVVIPRRLQARRVAASVSVSRAKDRAVQVENELRARMGDAKRAVILDRGTGEPVTVVSRSVTVVREHMMKETTRDQLYAGKAGKPLRDHGASRPAAA